MIKITEEIKKDAINRHVKWELKMFDYCCKKLHDEQKLSTNERRITHECFLLHARNLMDFLWPSSSSKSDDVCAKCFAYFHEKIDDEMNRIRNRINKQLSHITFNRSSPEQEHLPSKNEYIYQKLTEGLRAYNKCAEEKYRVSFS